MGLWKGIRRNLSQINTEEVTQTTNFLQSDMSDKDELYCLAVLEQRGEYIPSWQRTVGRASDYACIGYIIGWSVYHDQIPIDQAQRDLDSLGLGYVVDWVVAYSYLGSVLPVEASSR